MRRPDGSVVSPIIVVNEKFNTSAQYEETIKNKKDCIFQTLLKINGVVKATGLGYNAKISKIQAAFQFWSKNDSNTPTDLEKSVSRMTLRSTQRHQIDNNSGDSSSQTSGQVIQIPSTETQEYDDDCYSTGRKICLVVVITEFNVNKYNRQNAKIDAQLAKSVLQKRGFEVIRLVGSVTKKEFTNKLDSIKKEKGVDLFMLVFSSHGDEKDNVMFSDNEKWENKKSRFVFCLNCTV